MSAQYKAYLFGLSAVLAWSTVATAFKITLQHLSPSQLVLYASLFSLMSLLSILMFQGKLAQLIPALKQHWRLSLVLGAVNPFAYYLILFQAYAQLPAQEAQALNYTWALTMTLLAIPILRQRLRLQDAVAAVFCYCGVLVIATRGNPFSMEFANINGVVLALSSTLLWAFYWLFNTRDTRDPVIGLTLNFLLSTPMAFLYCLVTGAIALPAWHGMLGAAYIGALEMGFTFVLWLAAMKLTDSTAKIANLIFLSPLLSLLLINTFLGEPIFNSTLWGLGLILGGLAIQKIRIRHDTAALS